MHSHGPFQEKTAEGRKAGKWAQRKKLIYFGASDGIRKAFMRHAIHFTTQLRGSGEICADEKF